MEGIIHNKTRIPCHKINLKRSQESCAPINIADAGKIQIEFHLLGQLLGNRTYLDVRIKYDH